MWHLSRFQPSEIIDLAVQIEEKGAGFYQRLADKIETAEVKDLLMYLASEEEKHQEEFKRLGHDLALVSPRETYQGEYFEYVESTVNTHMFANEDLLEKAIKDASGPVDVAKLAISFEKDSILFFHSLRNLVNKDKQEVIDKLIKEEEGHINKLAKILKDYKSQGM